MPPMSAPFSLAFFSTARVAATVAAHQSSGSCSDQPGLGDEIGCGDVAVASTAPSSVQISVFVPLVPMSMPSRWGMGRVLRGERAFCPGWSRTQRVRREGAEEHEGGREVVPM